MMKGLQAIVFGSTGLVGKALIKTLIADKAFSKIVVVTRRKLDYRSKKIQQVVTDFEDLKDLEKGIKTSDVCFFCLGTTMKKAGSKDKFREIEYGITLKVAEICKNHGLEHFIYISSIGANHKSGNFYLCTKGEIELALQHQQFPKLSIVRPSMLLGPRKEKRVGESVGKILMVIFSPLLNLGLKRYKPIHSKQVANAMRRISKRARNSAIYESNDLIKIAKDKFRFD